MSEQFEQAFAPAQKSKKGNSKTKKFLTILAMSLLLLIPIMFMNGIITDRITYKEEAITKVSQSWASSQTIDNPVMYFKTVNNKKEDVYNNFELNNYEAIININTEIRKKGIFKVPVYTAEVIQKGDFENKYGDLSNKQVYLETGVSDSKGFVTEPVFKLNNGEEKKTQSIAYSTQLKTNAKNIPFEITYKVKGLKEITAFLTGNTNKITIKGNWENPEFNGDFLPTEREVTNKDFSATWNVPKIALSEYTQKPPAVSVSLLIPVDNYSMAERSLKYAFLLLSLTFTGYFIFEITSKERKKIHPIQYCLLGAAILIFYLLLVSMSELMPFAFAYLLSALMAAGLVYFYTYFVITKKQSIGFSIGITTLIGLLYAFFYILLMLQDIALFAGSLGIFAIIAVIMYFTKDVNWYGDENSEEK